MEMNLKTLNAQAISSTAETRKMGMSDDAQAIVFQMFTKNIYSNPIGTVVREITSNCFDSHIEAKVSTPVVIRKSFDKIANTHYISFIDFGVGMSPERVFDIYGMYFKSTKRVDNTQIGGFGIGGKTPLAYKRSTGFGEGEYDNSFNIITNYNGVKYIYCVFEGEDAPGITELYQEPTTEGNGTEIKIPVLEKDINTFKREMVRQLYYFENVVFDGFVNDENNKTEVENLLTNDFQIIRAKTFLFRGDEYSDNVHVCLGRVAYPIDYDVLGLSEYDFQFPVAIRLEIGEIGVTPSRESLNYSEATIKMLKKRLSEVKAEIVQMLSKQYDNIVSLEDYFKVKNNLGDLYFPNGNHFSVGDIIKEKDIDFSNFKYAFTKMPNDKQLFRLFFDSKVFGKKPRKNSWRYNDDGGDSEFTGDYDKLMTSNANLYYFEGEFERKIVKQAWLKQKHTTYYMLEKRNIANIHLAKDISRLFNVDDIIVDVTGQPTIFVQSLIEMQDEYYEIVTRQCTDYNAIVVPQDFIDSRKANARRLSEEFRKMTVPCKIFGSYNGNNRVKLESLFNLNVQIFYGLQEDDDTLRSSESIFDLLFGSETIVKQYDERTHVFSQPGKKGIMFIRMSKENIKYMQYCKNAKPISEFKTKIVRRKEDAVIEYFQSVNLIASYSNVQELYKSKNFRKLSPAWAKKFSTVEDYIQKINKKTNLKKNWSNYKYELSKWFNLSNIGNTKEQKVIVKLIAEMIEMQELNSETVHYLSIPYRMDEKGHETFWNIIEKMLVY
jgi:hypothetical protein